MTQAKSRGGQCCFVRYRNVILKKKSIPSVTGILSMHRVILYPAPSSSQVPRPTTNHHFHFLLFQLLSQGIEHLLSSSRTNLNLILPFSFSVHPSQERPWTNTDGSQGFSCLIRWGYAWHCTYLLVWILCLNGTWCALMLVLPAYCAS
jgi:hypothetical protein